MTTDDTVGFVGLGNMGQPMAARLVRAGFDVRAFDTAPTARDRSSAVGATFAPDLSSTAAGAMVVILMLPDSDAVAAVLQDQGFRSSLVPGTTVVDMGSSEPAQTRRWAETLAAEAITFLDAPVSGGVAGAEGGSLTVMVGGNAEQIEPVSSVLGQFGRVVPTGPVGSGHAAKALNNLLSATHLLATSEAMEAGRCFGIDEQVLLDVFNTSSGRSGSTEVKWPKFVVTESFDSGFGLRLMVKDMRIAVRLAEESKSEIGLGSAAARIWAGAADELEPTADHTQIAQWVRDQTSC